MFLSCEFRDRLTQIAIIVNDLTEAKSSLQ